MHIHYARAIFQKILQFITSKNWTELYGYVYDFSIGYDSIDVDDTLDIHKYLMKKHNIK